MLNMAEIRVLPPPSTTASPTSAFKQPLYVRKSRKVASPNASPPLQPPTTTRLPLQIYVACCSPIVHHGPEKGDSLYLIRKWSSN
ncbi:hypothetical protein SLA2020_244020 [Shorea laevis]